MAFYASFKIQQTDFWSILPKPSIVFLQQLDGIPAKKLPYLQHDPNTEGPLLVQFFTT